MRAFALILALSAAAACASVRTEHAPACEVSLMVLGTAQDGGRPQIANPNDRAWHEASRRRIASALALVDQRAGETRRWLFDATPDIRAQLQMLDERFPLARPIGLDGIFLTHAHIGHYTGLMFFGRESAGARGLPVHAMHDMKAFLENNGPWSQLVRYNNISLNLIRAGEPVELTPQLSVVPLTVPHRQEFSEVAAFHIRGPARTALYLPDINSWEQWDAQGAQIENYIHLVDYAFLDGTFYANGEIPGRDMSGFPHPFITHSMQRFAALPASERAKIRFIHLNHTNPANDPGTPARRAIEAAGFSVAREGDIVCL